MLKIVIVVGAVLISTAAPRAAPPPPVRAPACQTSSGDVEAADFETRQCITSPDGRKRVVVDHGRITVEQNGAARPAGVTDNGRIVWSPTSTGFAVADSGGSGQTNYFSYVDIRRVPLQRDKRLRHAAAKLYASTFKCGGPAAYVFSWFEGWQDDGRVRLVVQEGVHSEGCHHRDPEDVEIGVIGDPATGRIDRVLTQAQVQAEWCTPAERREYGLCYVAGTAQNATR